jgi:cyclophilin family peptidyl-prolyl cis-trans isomerase
MAQLEEKYPDDLQVVYRHFPLMSIHDKAGLASQAAEAAGLQNRFWEMHDRLFSEVEAWSGLEIEQFQEWVLEQAEDLGLDQEKFADDLTSDSIESLVQEAYDHNASIGMPGTPFLVANGYPYQGSRSLEGLSAYIESVLLEKKHFNECPELNVDPTKEYIATIETEKGDIELELYAEEAPLAVNSFIFLAGQGWFDNVTFHRVIPGFVAQAGDPSGSGMGGPGYIFDNEISPDLVFDEPGVLAMANSGPDTNGSQFFITYAPAPSLDGNYTIFGAVIEGMDILESLTARDPSKQTDLPPGDVILSVTIEEK